VAPIAFSINRIKRNRDQNSFNTKEKTRDRVNSTEIIKEDRVATKEDKEDRVEIIIASIVLMDLAATKVDQGMGLIETLRKGIR
jgi:hypothetical protein